MASAKKTAKKKAAAKKPAAKRGNRLSPKEEKFVNNYVASGNATQAARDAGYSERSARELGHRLLTKVDILERITERLQEENVTADEVVSTLAAQMRSAITDVLPDDGGLISQIKDNKLGHLIRKIKLRRELEIGTGKQFEVVELELYSAQQAAIQLSKIKGLEYAPEQNPKDAIEAIITDMLKEDPAFKGKTRKAVAEALYPNVMADLRQAMVELYPGAAS